MKIINIALCFLFMLSACNRNETRTEIIQKKRNNIENLSNEIKNIETNVIFGAFVDLAIIDNYLIIGETSSQTIEALHIYDKNTFKFITSAIPFGEGPGEIAMMGPLGVDTISHSLWITDLCKMILSKYPIDSILNNPLFIPTENIELDGDLFMTGNLEFINDSLALGMAIHNYPDDPSGFEVSMSKLNIVSKVTTRYGYSNPQIEGKRTEATSSILNNKNGYVLCHTRCDLMTICDIKGNLICNVYGGGDWYNKDKKKNYYEQVYTYKDYIIASYNGGLGIVLDENKRPKGTDPTKFLIFDAKGNYIKTIETGSSFNGFCVDQNNNRIILCFNDREHLLGYIDLNLE